MAKKQNITQKQYCNKFDKDFKNMVHIKKSLEKKNVMAQNLRGVSRPEDLVFRATILSTVNWQLPFTSARIKSCAAADLQHPQKDFRVNSRNEASGLGEKIGRTGLQIVS